MRKIKKITNITLIAMLIWVFLWAGVGYGLRPPLQCSSTQREFTEQLNSGSANKSDKQRLIAMDVLEIPQKTDIGEKPYKLLKMAQAGLNVPPFFIIIGDGSGELTVTDEVRTFFGKLCKPVIVRSAHKDEGAKYSFSGVFESYKDITTLEPTPTEVISEDQEGYWEHGFRPESLQSAYHLIVDGAEEGYKIKKYLEGHHIADFNPKQMNAVVMEQIDIEVFGMFLTSSQNNPNEVLIHYQVIGKNADEKQAEPPPDMLSIDLKEKGGVITYNKRTHELGDNELDEQTREALRQFGEIAGQIEKMFGVQQIELGASNGRVYVFQSRDINLANPADAPRLAYYKTMSEELSVIGYGNYRLPVLVISSLDDAHPEFKKSKEYRELVSAFQSTPNNQMEEKQNRLKALLELTRAENNKYKEELLRFARENPEYILVIKDAESIVFTEEDLLLSKSYDFLNLLTSKAKVIIRGRNQNAIRHGDWDNVELGGITVIPPEESGIGGFMQHFVFARESDSPRFNYASNRPSKVSNNVSIQMPGKIATGDFLNVLSNTDGVFVWVDEQGAEDTINRIQKSRDQL